MLCFEHGCFVHHREHAALRCIAEDAVGLGAAYVPCRSGHRKPRCYARPPDPVGDVTAKLISRKRRQAAKVKDFPNRGRYFKDARAALRDISRVGPLPDLGMPLTISKDDHVVFTIVESSQDAE